MKLLCKVYDLLFCAWNCQAQNLIPNSSFEDTSALVNQFYLPTKWKIPNTSSPDYITSLHKMTWGVPSNYAGYQQARTGEAYMGLLIYTFIVTPSLREYIQVQLNDSLQKDSTYCLQFYISLADSMHFASRKMLGVHFANIAISSTNIFALPYVPQIVVSDSNYIDDKTNWTEFNFEYIAKGGEEYITIGNFNDTNKVDSLFVGGGIQIPYQGTYYYIDDVYLGDCDSLPNLLTATIETSTPIKANIYPNPVKDILKIKDLQYKPIAVQLSNILGQTFELDIVENHQNYELPFWHLPKGIYFLTITTDEGRNTFKILKE